ncbi:methylated-DNA--protein-cysteine methyltransferase [Denticeps clupeoides]|uniref:Methylated-DNA--protein-cysteine methyltransferase n=1 Tax=Denticeps clupeoides TaxID=299321 RepID=A0AAY4DJU1_9TELE|nr:methylated-DNA--protein-cysteine methyltransferase [Denticeps clupeoides]
MGEGCQVQSASLVSPLGQVHILGCPKGVHRIEMHPESRDRSVLVSGCVRIDYNPSVKLNPELQRGVEWLEAYFTNPHLAETLPLPALHSPILLGESFTANVLRTLLHDVPVGQTVSYGRLAEMSGNLKAVRAVGGAMRRNPVPLIIPCHRVVLSSGQLGRYMNGRGDDLKQWLLNHEKNSTRSC